MDFLREILLSKLPKWANLRNNNTEKIPKWEKKLSKQSLKMHHMLKG